MKVAIISEYNSFSTIGGTEYYVKMLLEGICSLGVDLLLITKGTTKQTERLNVALNDKSYNICFIAQQEFINEEIKQKVISKSGPLIMHELELFKPDIIHVHTLTTFFNIFHIEVCAKIFKNIVFTAHVPVHFCAKGDLIQNNSKPCDGKIEKIKCSICLFTKSYKVGISNLLSGHYSYPLRLLKRLNENSVHIMTPSLWQKEQIGKNGFEKNKITVIRQALTTKDYVISSCTPLVPSFTIGYLGRLSPEKGSMLLLSVINKLVTMDASIQFVLGIPANSDPNEVKKMEVIALQNKNNITVLKDVNSSNKNIFFDKISCLFIPSFFLETGPIVLLEALFYNKKVLTPNVGGTLEFSQEFPKDVICYNWNDIDSACTELVKLNKEIKPTEVDYVTILKQQEKDFIEKHLAVYNSMFPHYFKLS